MLTRDNIATLYRLVDADPQRGVFSYRIGQVFNMMLYKIGSPAFTSGLYRMTSFMWSVFRKRK
jgi:hypothetical protein